MHKMTRLRKAIIAFNRKNRYIKVASVIYIGYAVLDETLASSEGAFFSEDRSRFFGISVYHVSGHPDHIGIY